MFFIAALTTAVLFLPLAAIQTGGASYTFDVMGISTAGVQLELVYPTWGLFVLTAAIALIALVTIFLYKKRVLQIRLSVFNAILMLGFYALFAFFAYRINQGMGVAGELQFSYKIALTFPAIALILDYLAIRNIGADEMLVRSLDRLR